jgi:hypothetical protein
MHRNRNNEQGDKRQLEPLAQAGDQRRPVARKSCTTNSYASINPRSAKASGSFIPPRQE